MSSPGLYQSDKAKSDKPGDAVAVAHDEHSVSHSVAGPPAPEGGGPLVAHTHRGRRAGRSIGPRRVLASRRRAKRPAGDVKAVRWSSADSSAAPLCERPTVASRAGSRRSPTASARAPRRLAGCRAP